MKRPKTSPSRRKAKATAGSAAQRRAKQTGRRRRRRFDPTRPFRSGKDEGPPPEISYARIVLWGARGDDIQVGSFEDHLQEYRRTPPRALEILEAIEKPYVEAMEAYRPAMEALTGAFLKMSKTLDVFWDGIPDES